MPEERLMTVEEFWEMPEKPGTRLELFAECRPIFDHMAGSKP
jgi:hypothetical protein